MGEPIKPKNPKIDFSKPVELPTYVFKAKPKYSSDELRNIGGEAARKTKEESEDKNMNNIVYIIIGLILIYILFFKK